MTDPSATTAARIYSELIAEGYGFEFDAITRVEYGESDTEAFIEYDPEKALRLLLVFQAEKADEREDMNGYAKLRRDYNSSEQTRTQFSHPDDDEAPWLDVNDDGTVTVHSNAGAQENFDRLVIMQFPQDLMREVAKTILALPEKQDETFPDNPSPWVIYPEEWTK